MINHTVVQVYLNSLMMNSFSFNADYNERMHVWYDSGLTCKLFAPASFFLKKLCRPVYPYCRKSNSFHCLPACKERALSFFAFLSKLLPVRLDKFLIHRLPLDFRSVLKAFENR